MENVSDILISWNLAELVDVFTQNEIDLEVFEQLNADIIKELIPKIGLRVKFTRKYKEYISRNDDVGLAQVYSISDVNANTTSSSQDDSDSDIIPASHYLNKSCKNKRELESVFDPINKLDIKHLLRSTCAGQSLLVYYSKHETLDRSHRQRLVDLIINYICELSSESVSLTNQQIENIAIKITEIFPSEVKETYYVPPIRKAFSKDGKSGVAKGKLVDKYRNSHYKLLKGVVNKKRIESPSSCSTNEDNRDSNTSKHWLDTRCEPWEEVVLHWKKTFCLRQINKSQTVSELYLEWPLLKHKNGPALTPADIEDVIEEKRRNSCKPIQPYIIAVGCTEVIHGYVIVDEIRYVFDSILRAFEITFKIFHVMNVKYPVEAEHIWFTIQLGLFNVETPWDKHIPYVMELIQSCKQSQ